MNELLINSNFTLLIGKQSEQLLLLSNNIAQKIVSINNIETIYNEMNEKDMINLLVNSRKKSKPILLHFNNLISFKMSDSLKKIIYNARLLNIFIVMTIDANFHLKPDIRCNIDLVITCRETENCIIEKLYLYFGVIPTMKDFIDLIKNLDENTALCLNKNKIKKISLSNKCNEIS